MSDLPHWLLPVHDEIVSRFESEKLAHASLIVVPSGWGVVELLEQVVASVAAIKGDLREFGHPDIKWLRSNQDGETLSRPGSNLRIGVDEVRSVIEFMNQSPLYLTHRLAVIESADRLTTEASNALLKILEEPPNDHYFFLTTAYEYRLLPTVRSRCSTLRVYRAESSVVSHWLQQQGTNPSDLTDLMVEFGGAPFHVRDVLRRKVQISFLQQLRDLWSTRTPEKVALDMAQKLSRSEDFDELISRWQRTTYRLVVARPKLLEAHQFFARLSDVKRKNTDTAGLNKQLELEILLFDWLRLKTATPR